MSRRPTLKTLVEDYLAFRRRLGYAMRGIDHLLRDFARYAVESGHRGPITIALAVRWAKLPKDTDPSWWARRLSVVRSFARHRRLFDPRTEIPAVDLLGPYLRRRAPHIYSAAEMAALLRAAAALPPTGSLRPRTYLTLLGLLASTGLRISEALRLKRGDVDLVAGVLTIAKTKFHKSRFVPLHPSATKALRRYAAQRDRHYPQPPSSTFFVNQLGTALGGSGVYKTFGILRQQLGWKKGASGRRPRLHDLRHTMAVRRLLGWYEEGVDIHGKIATLSTYLGHVEVTDTYWYLTAVPELLAVAAGRFESFAAGRRVA